jgi:hypothetical protein
MSRNARSLCALAILSCLSPALAWAGHDEDRDRRYDEAEPRPRPASAFLVVHNPNHSPVEVLLDDVVVGSVAANQTQRMGPFAEGERSISTRFRPPSGRALALSCERERLDARYPARIEVPWSEHLVLELLNAWIEDLDLRVDGRSFGRLPADSRLVMAIEGGWRQVELLGPQGEVAMRRGVSGTGLEPVRLELVPPTHARVTIHNPARQRLALLDESGAAICDLPPRSSHEFELPSGRIGLQASWRGRTVDRVRLLASPFRSNDWRVRLPDHGPLQVVNENPVTLSVFADERFLGRVEAGATGRFSGVRAGGVTVRMEAEAGRHGLQQVAYVTVDPLDGASLRPVFDLGHGRHGHCEGHGHGHVSSREQAYFRAGLSEDRIVAEASFDPWGAMTAWFRN